MRLHPIAAYNVYTEMAEMSNVLRTVCRNHSTVILGRYYTLYIILGTLTMVRGISEGRGAKMLYILLTMTLPSNYHHLL